MKLLKEFKDFAVKGNMIDMAIGIIIGASFNAIVNVLVKNIIPPEWLIIPPSKIHPPPSNQNGGL